MGIYLLEGGTLVLSLAALLRLFVPLFQTGLIFHSLRWQAAGLAALCFLLLQIGILAFTVRRGKMALLERLDGVLRRFSRLGWLNLLLLAGIGAALPLLAFSLPAGRYLEYPALRLLFFWVTALAGAFLVAAWRPGSGLMLSLAASVLTLAVLFKLGTFFLDLSSYPFSLNWSEASRYYYASLFFAGRIYGLDLPPTVLHPSRYLLQAVPYLVPGTPLAIHRLWQVILWIGITGLASWQLVRRLHLQGSRLYSLLLVAWIFLFQLIGPVFYHLQVVLILVLLGFDPHAQQPSRRAFSFLVVVLASAWAGISRINWFPMAGLLASVIYLLETPLEGKPLWRYLLLPAAWSLAGMISALLSQMMYISWSGNASSHFASSLTSDLLWYRLLPNPTFPLGVLPGALLFSFPLFWLLWLKLGRKRRSYHWLRLAALAAILLLLFAGGMVVSVKIGGGSNLHNLDAYLSLLLVVVLWTICDRFLPDRVSASSAEAAPGRSPAWLAASALALLLPVYFTISLGGPLTYPSPDETNSALQVLRRKVQGVIDTGGEVLFISERQLVTFGDLGKVPLVPDYERVFLMEMAMADNQEYLSRFYTDLEQHRYALIISEPLFLQRKGSQESFGEENDAWVRRVSRPVLCDYAPLKDQRLAPFHLELYVPRPAQKCR